ncbi:sensor histidine kinase [Gracilimonas mengyeensis]|uniref:Histidine kinase-, DNA gyrase B-, and HSP90-like ATPase n=1 Tax=Gracilimonas mengyeensis TaxID=1302730 RepID=A0A521E5P1_9BACT|nr:histidine kinase [Gracilimonas mengyeensis]SMO79182.1 Histidine kinase-, DNA gyrase B-, and HSP90-like ATPase [Gracilimonas mengyeensis]
MQTAAISEKPQVTKKGLLLTAFFWAVFTLLSAGLLTYSNQVPFIYSLLGTMLNTSIMLLYMVCVWFLLVRKLHESSWLVKLLLHGVTSILFTVAWYYSYLFMFDLIFGLQYLGSEFQDNQAWIMFSTFIEYVVVFAVIHVIESLKTVNRKDQQAAELKELSRKQEIATLKAQINPHFLFNTLNSINASVTAQPHQAREMITRLSDMLRYSLDSFDKSQVPLSEEITFIKTYLELEKTRLGDRLKVAFNIDDTVKQFSIPPMICQPLVENAVKHGIAPLEEGGEIHIIIKEKEDAVYFTVADTGKGLQKDAVPKDHAGIGLKNTNEMLVKRFGPEASLKIEPNHPKGTKVSFKIPTS